MSENPILTNEDQTCPTVGYQSVDVCVPVTVTPFAKTGATYTKCCGDPVVVSGDTPCGGKKNGTCSFTITQQLCVAVPVEFGATAAVGDTYVNCLGASEEECPDCKDRFDATPVEVAFGVSDYADEPSL